MSGHDELMETLGISNDAFYTDKNTASKLIAIDLTAKKQILGFEESAWEDEIDNALVDGDYWSAGLASHELAKDLR